MRIKGNFFCCFCCLIPGTAISLMITPDAMKLVFAFIH